MLVDFEARMEARDIVRRVFAALEERDQEMILDREVYGVPLREIAGERGLTVNRVRQLESRGLRRARGWLAWHDRLIGGEASGDGSSKRLEDWRDHVRDTNAMYIEMLKVFSGFWQMTAGR